MSNRIVNQTQNTISDSTQLRRRFSVTMVALLITFVAVVSATYAWYVYNTSRHTTNVRMAAGAGVNLQISNSYNGTYGSAAVLDSFLGRLVPVSTNRISGGFQKVTGFTGGDTRSIPACSFAPMEIPLIFICQISDLRTVMRITPFPQPSV